MSRSARLRARAARAALVPFIAVVAAVGLAGPAGAQDNDVYGTGVHVDDSVNCPIGPRPAQICIEAAVNNAGSFVPPPVSVKDPVSYGLHESVHAWAGLRAITTSGAVDVALVPDWVKAMSSWRQLGPVEDALLIADSVFFSTNATMTANHRWATTCDSGAICVFEHANGNDHADARRDPQPRKLQWVGNDQRIEFSQHGFNDQASSVRSNKNRTDAKMWKDNPAGESKWKCVDSDSYDPHFGSFNDEASLLIIRSTGNDSDC